jgi:outer membrane lipoprotein carrier protein
LEANTLPLRWSLLASTILAWTCVPLFGQQPAERGDVVAFVQTLQHKYDATRDFTAAFVHTYEGGALRRKSTEEGDVVVKKPGRMRWTYSKPETKTFVSDGLRMYSYVPADRQVIVSKLPDDRDLSAPIMFLIGKGDLARDFVATWPSEAETPPGTAAVRLTPKQRQPEYVWLLLAVDARTMQLRVIRSLDGQGGTSTFTLSDMKENQNVADSRFEFKIPRGTDVITQ